MYRFGVEASCVAGTPEDSCNDTGVMMGAPDSSVLGLVIVLVVVVIVAVWIAARRLKR